LTAAATFGKSNAKFFHSCEWRFGFIKFGRSALIFQFLLIFLSIHRFLTIFEEKFAEFCNFSNRNFEFSRNFSFRFITPSNLQLSNNKD